MSKGKYAARPHGVCPRLGKFQYESRSAAKRALKQLQNTGQAHRQERAAYHCQFCDLWHLTSQKPKNVPADRRVTI